MEDNMDSMLSYKIFIWSGCIGAWESDKSWSFTPQTIYTSLSARL